MRDFVLGIAYGCGEGNFCFLGIAILERGDGSWERFGFGDMWHDLHVVRVGEKVRQGDGRGVFWEIRRLSG